MYCVWPPYILRPTTRLAYCTVIFRTPCVIVITAAMTMIRNNTNNTKTIGFTWLEPGESNGLGVISVVPDHSHRGGDHDYARRAEDHRAVCQARSWSQNVRRPDAIHAFESELRGGNANHLRLGAASLSRDDCPV